MTTPIPTTRVQEVGENQNIELLGKVIDGLIGVLSPQDQGTTGHDTHNIWKSPRGYKGIEGMVRERCLVDLIAGCGELALNPEHNEVNRAAWKEKFSHLIEGIQTGALLPLLLSLLHPASPLWFRQPIAKYLSQLPVSRPHGVRNILKLFLSTASSGNISNSASTQLSVDALSKASRLISSIPTSMSAQEYFSKVCPQLLEILRSTDPGMERAAAYVIAELLGKKGQGVEDTVENEIVRKIIANFDPSIAANSLRSDASSEQPKPESKKSSSALLAFEDELTADQRPSQSPLVFEIADETNTTMVSEVSEEPTQPGPLVSEAELSMSFRNLEVLLASHPTPLLPQRLISPILIPLWGLMGYAKSIGRSAWHNRAAALLKSYLTVSLNQAVLEKIQNSLTFTGGDGWEYAPGSSGGIEIRTITKTKKSGMNMDLINSRVEEFLGILGDDSVPNGVLNEFFLGIFRNWLARREEEEPLKMLITVKILQEMLQTHGETLAKKPTEILQIIKGVLDEYVNFLEASKRPKRRTIGVPRLSTLGKIVQDPLPSELHTGDAEEDSDEIQHAETVAMALTLLSVLVSSPETKLTEADERLVTTLHPSLEYLSTAKNIDPNLTSLAINITSLLILHAPQVAKSTSTPLAETQREKYTTALSYLRDPLIPVRAHGLHLLRELILERAPIVDITNTARLLISMLKDGDSFIYLNVVKCLAALTDRHSRTVTKMLVDAYINDEDVLDLGERLGLDERLRIGEALLGTVQRLNRALVGEVAEVVTEGMLSIISRRRNNPNPPPLPPVEEDEMELDIDPTTGAQLTPQQLQQRERDAKMVTGWTTTAHEDLRIRTSALSILGTVVQTNPSGLGPRYLQDALDTALAILSQETSLEASILRRAAVVAVGAVLNGLVKADEEDREGRMWREDVWSVVKHRVRDMKRVLGYVRVTDVDGLVREQAGVVEENLEAVAQRGMVGGRGTMGDHVGRIEIL
ncbi:hypothetical protein BDD12DRAFT_851933 [Trichophaea hybrida]|nr:hypothetical protein BDD12DRAFT_851933 [Trichophaea hybrida]